MDRHPGRRDPALPAEDRIGFALFEAGHTATDYRYLLSLTWLAERLAR
jgi:hypothetical protein